MKTEIEIKEKIAEIQKNSDLTTESISKLERHSELWCEMVIDLANKKSKINLLKWVLSES